MNYLSWFSYCLVFYCCYHKLLHWHLDHIPVMPKLKTPFEEIIEIDTAQYISRSSAPLVPMDSTIIVSPFLDQMFVYFDHV